VLNSETVRNVAVVELNVLDVVSRYSLTVS
jgi:hypothetical protein